MQGISKLEQIENVSSTEKNSRSRNKAKEIKDFLIDAQIDLEQLKLVEEDQIISPSDVGIHNMLINKSGLISFIDFEYSGLDDIAKLACDMILQPNSLLSREQTELWLNKLKGIKLNTSKGG